MKYKIGLDIGITSVGWAVMLLNKENEPYKIDRMGVRIFDAAEYSKDGSSLAKPRRDARGARRRLRRHRHRIERLKNLMIENQVITQDELSQLYKNPHFEKEIYTIRTESLDRQLTRDEFVRLLIHLAQRRGFKSNRKTEINDKKLGALTGAVAQNKMIMADKEYRSVGEMFLKDERFNSHKRNKAEEYIATVARDDVIEEINLIFEKQQEYGCPFVLQGMQQKVVEIISSQRPFDVGPGKGSKYAGDQIAKMIGKCTFEKTENRAAKATYTFEYFQLLQKVNQFKIINQGAKRDLTEIERIKLIELAFLVKDLKYQRIRKELSLNKDDLFGDLNYYRKTIEEAEKNNCAVMQNYHKIRSVLDKVYKGRITELKKEQLDWIGTVFSINKSDENIIKALRDGGIEEKDIEALLSLEGFSKFGSLSIKAMDNITGYLEQGMLYDKACAAAGYNFRAHGGEKQIFLNSDIIEELNIPNPVVIRAISQTRKVINAIIRQYGQSPAFIGIELARELSKDFFERKQIEKKMKENETGNEKIKNIICETYHKSKITGLDIVKYKLFQEQDGICLYSMKPLEAEKLFDVGYCDIDHIIPYSICFDDGYRNKVLVRAEENRQKGNRLPMEYLKEKGRNDEFNVWVQANIRDKDKAARLLKEKLTKEDEEGFKERNLNDTKYIAKQMYNLLNDHLLFDTEGTEDRKKRVVAVNGNITAYMRKRWGIAKVREDGDMHHAVDAAVVACITDKVIQKVTNFEKRRETEERLKDIKNHFPQPYETFSKEIEARTFDDPQSILRKLNLPNYTDEDINDTKPIFVSRMANHKVTGAAHKETIKSPKMIDEGYTIKKISIQNLKLNTEGEIENYYNPKDDTLLYNALVNQLRQHNNNGEQAFKEPFYKPTASGILGNLVKKVKIMEKASLTVPVHGGKGLADNDSMVRIDIFNVPNDGYYFVPIYISDVKKEILPNKAVVANKPYKEWKEMKDEHFLFSLTKNDLIRFKAKKDATFTLTQKESTLPKEAMYNECLVYYIGSNISTGAIGVITHDNTYTIGGMGIKTLLFLEKYTVDLMGNYQKVKKEKRQYFDNRHLCTE